MRRPSRAASVVAVFAPLAQAQLAVVSTSPALNASNVARASTVSVTFDRALNTSTVTASNFRVFGKGTGPVAGALAFSNANRTVTLTPPRPFMAGEVVQVFLSHNLRAADATFLRNAGYTLSFTVRAAPAPRVFRRKAAISNRANAGTGTPTRIYGAQTCDLNHDGWADLTTVNQDASDVRVFLNRADASGLMQPMLTPFTPVPTSPSPNDVADFDSDGNVDVALACGAVDQVSVLFGNGNGTFRAPVNMNAGDHPRGTVVLDADADGDLDFAVANSNSNTITLFLNNGAGVFAAPISIPVAGGPYGLAAADMNNDAILDLVAGCQNDQTCKILRGNGNATYTLVSTTPIGGGNWVVVCGDLNNDGTIDVSAANAFSQNGAILLGNGNGTLQPASLTPTAGHATSTDLADIDGDADLDWILSSFGADLWYVYLNDGTGHFTAFRTFPAPAGPSCAAPVDIDGDGDIDLVLTDEESDLLLIMLNVCTADFDDGSGTGVPDGGVTIDDLLYYLGAFDAGLIAADVDNGTSTGTPDGGVTIDDLLYFLARFDAGC